MEISFGDHKAIAIDPGHNGSVRLTITNKATGQSNLIDLDHASALTVAKAIEDNARTKTR